jgi:hypothetical protein
MLWAIIILGVITVLLLFLLARQSTRLNSLSRRYDADIRKARTESVKQSRAVQLGGIADQIAPLLPGFPYDPKDCRWAGQPVDMIVFDGLEGDGDINVVFLEIKTGKSQQNKHQRRVKAAVDAGRVQFDVYRPDLQWGAPVETPALELLSPGGQTSEDSDEEPDFGTVDLGEIGQELPDERWEDAITDVLVADDPPPRRYRTGESRPPS